jgi:CheY-specific phosphatase CheX
MKRAGFMDVYEVMQDHLIQAACAVMAEISAEVTEVRDGTSLDLGTEVVVSMIGYSADACRGAIVVVSSPAFLRAVQTGTPPPATAADMADMQGELSNMVLGRLKTMMLKRGVTFGVTTPTSVVGADVMLPPPKGGTSTWHRFSSACGALHVRFDVIFEPSFVLASTDAPREGDAAEGDVLVF